jgi:hypothetical protein
VLKLKEESIKQRKAEESLHRQMIEEQKMIEELSETLEENLLRTAQLRKYNREMKEQMQHQVYQMHGISRDKREGMANYKKAYYTGSAFAILVLSVVMVVITGIIHDFDSDVCLFMAFFTALEGAILATEEKKNLVGKAIFRVLYFLLFPAMMVIFVCHELGYPEYEMFLPYFSIAGMVIFALSMISYFTYNPYHGERRNIRNAKMKMKNIQKAAAKSVKKAEKTELEQEREKEREKAREIERQKKLEKEQQKKQEKEKAKEREKEREQGKDERKDNKDSGEGADRTEQKPASDAVPVSDSGVTALNAAGN